MILGTGVDIVEIDRIATAKQRYQQRFLDRIFTKEEQSYCQRHGEEDRHLAARFAAKEAVVKALGCGIGATLGWLDIHIVSKPSGQPQVNLSEKGRRTYSGVDFHLSISHAREYAVAFVIATKS